MCNTYRKSVKGYEYIDVYRILELYGVKCHATGHAVKKLLCAGERGFKDKEQDLREAIQAISRAIEMMGEDRQGMMKEIDSIALRPSGND